MSWSMGVKGGIFPQEIFQTEGGLEHSPERKFGNTSVEQTKGERKLENILVAQPSPFFVLVVKLRKLWRTGYVTYVGKCEMYT